MADAIFRVWKSKGVQGPAVGAAPSNVAADNLARRLLKTTTLDVKRYGPPGKITDADVRRISSQAMAIAADPWPESNSRKAKKRRRQWENDLFREKTDVVIGTLEMASDLEVASKLILVDEAAQNVMQSIGTVQSRKLWNTLDLVNGSPERTNS